MWVGGLLLGLIGCGRAMEGAPNDAGTSVDGALGDGGETLETCGNELPFEDPGALPSTVFTGDRDQYIPHFTPDRLPASAIGVFGQVHQVDGVDSGAPHSDRFQNRIGWERQMFVLSDDPQSFSVTTTDFTGAPVTFPHVDWPGLPRPLALVEVEVNGGAGSTSDAASAFEFVATRLRVLDGTPEYPLHVAGVVSKLDCMYRMYLASRQREIDQAVERGLEQAFTQRRPSTVPAPTLERIVTWIPDQTLGSVSTSPHLLVRYRTTIPSGFIFAGCGDALTGCTATGWGPYSKVELGLAYEIAPSGHLTRTETLPLQVTTGDVPPPP
jgi:hypothetical protein